MPSTVLLQGSFSLMNQALGCCNNGVTMGLATISRWQSKKRGGIGMWLMRALVAYASQTQPQG